MPSIFRPSQWCLALLAVWNFNTVSLVLGMGICDDFSRSDGGLGGDWEQSGQANAQINGESITCSSIDGCILRYEGMEYDPTDHRAKVDITLSVIDGVSQIPAVGIFLGLSTTPDSDYSGIQVLIRDMTNLILLDNIPDYDILSTTSMGIATDDLETTFTMEVHIDSNGDVLVTLSGFVSGGQMGNTLNYNLGPISTSQYDSLGYEAGLELFRGDSGNSVVMDNFQHSGCLTPSTAPSPSPSTAAPTARTTSAPTSRPPTVTPGSPTESPTDSPTQQPTTRQPTTHAPSTIKPTTAPPTVTPGSPTNSPTDPPSRHPTEEPTYSAIPTISSAPSNTPTITPYCGDKVLNSPAEECDGSDFGDQSCTTLNFSGGTLLCDSSCTFDTSYCTTCGDGVAQFDEVCDGSDLRGMTCSSFGFDEDPYSLSCSNSCQFDVTGCSKCGDGRISGQEACEGDDLNGATCESLGFHGGTLSCTDSCGFDTSQCLKCGDGIVTYPEELCDGSNFNGHTCESFGFSGGSLACADNCMLDVSSCTSCGNAVVDNDSEECDYLDLDGTTCEDLGLGFNGGVLACDGTCHYDTSGCTTANPSMTPSIMPSDSPSESPSSGPSQYPSTQPSSMPSSQPSASPAPSLRPSQSPSELPSLPPSKNPSESPTDSMSPSNVPSIVPTLSSSPSTVPSGAPTTVAWEHDFDTSSTHFVLVPYLFGGTISDTDYVEGATSTTAYGKSGESGGYRIRLTSPEMASNEELSGGWNVTFTLSEAVENARFDLNYKLAWKRTFTSGDVGQLMVAIDGTTTVVATHDTYPGHTSWTHGQFEIGDLDAGDHLLEFGAFYTTGVSSTNQFQIRFDNLAISGTDAESSSTAANGSFSSGSTTTSAAATDIAS